MLVRKALFALVLFFVSTSMQAQYATHMYHCEIGVQGGMGYYAGDATPLPGVSAPGINHLNNISWVAGGHFRYKFDQRWSLQLKGLYHQIGGQYYDNRRTSNPWFKDNDSTSVWKRNNGNIDITAEFNFFRFGAKVYDSRVKQWTPYIFAGVGITFDHRILQSKDRTALPYIPVGIGIKWKFADRWGLNVMWQHNFYLVDKLENVAQLHDTYDFGGWNPANNDHTGQITAGIVFEFAKEKKICRFCDEK